MATAGLVCLERSKSTGLGQSARICLNLDVLPLPGRVAFSLGGRLLVFPVVRFGGVEVTTGKDIAGFIIEHLERKDRPLSEDVS